MELEIDLKLHEYHLHCTSFFFWNRQGIAHGWGSGLIGLYYKSCYYMYLLVLDLPAQTHDLAKIPVLDRKKTGDSEDSKQSSKVNHRTSSIWMKSPKMSSKVNHRTSSIWMKSPKMSSKVNHRTSSIWMKSPKMCVLRLTQIQVCFLSARA